MAISAGIGIAVVGAGAQFAGQKRQQKAVNRRAEEITGANRRAEAIQTRKDNIISARQRARSIAEQRRFTGQSIQQAINQGGGGTIGALGSTIPGLVGNLKQQLGANFALQGQITEANTGIRTAFGQARELASEPIKAGDGLTAFGGFLVANAASLGEGVHKIFK